MMKKIISVIFIFIVFIAMFIFKSVYAVTPTLDEIANKFNNCNTVKEYANLGSEWKASSNGNKLTVMATANSTTTNFEYTLSGSILSANFSGDDAFSGLAVTIVLTDCIGQLHGYSDGELFTTLNSDKIANYTVENEGFEAKEITDKNYQIKIDTSKKIPLIDVSDVYIEVSDLQDLKSYISGDGFAEKSKGNIWFNKSGYGGENTLLIAEKDNLTENTYKSILSIIEVMFDSSKASDYFKTNYSGMSVGNKEFAGIKIEINPTKTEMEESLIPSDSEYKFARITIDKSLVNSAIVGNNPNAEKKEKDNKTDNGNGTVKERDNTLPQGKLPQTGLNIFLPIVSVIIITLIAIIFCKKHNNYKDVK